MHSAPETIFEVLPNAPSMCDMKTVIVGGVTWLFQRVTVASATNDFKRPSLLREVASGALAGLKILREA